MKNMTKNLGERIYQLRTEKNLSQGDLAELLEVSRQSVSKWENNSATPDLEKIVKLSEIFGMTIDELVKGAEGISVVDSDGLSKKTVAEQTTVKKEEHSAGADCAVSKEFPLRKVVGIILFCMAFLVMLVFLVMNAFFAGLILAVPFLACGIICMVCKKHAGLWCVWALYICVDVYVRMATGISPGVIRLTGYWTPEMNFYRLLTAWIQFLSLGALVGVTVWKFRKEPVDTGIVGRNKLILLWGMLALAEIFVWGLAWLYRGYLTCVLSTVMVYSLTQTLISWCRIILFTAALSHTVRYIRGKRFCKKAGANHV